MAPLKLKVLISGAGIAGPCLAYWLTKTRHDISITIIERAPAPRVTGQAIDIRGAAIDIVKRMKMEEAIRAAHTTEEGTKLVNSSGKAFAEFTSGDTFTAEYEILRADLSRLFMEATEGADNIKYVYGDSIASVEQMDKAVHITFVSGSKDTFDLLVAADGSTSRTRPMILDEETLKHCYKFIGQYMAFFSIPSKPTDPKVWQWYSAPKGITAMIRPHRNPATMGAYLVITVPGVGKQIPAVEAALDKGIREQKVVLHEHFDNAGWETKRLLEGMDQAEDFYMTRAALVRLPKWTNGRALVLGDAAFATFGIGTSLAIESAYILAGELSKIRSNDDIPRALETYEEVFRKNVYGKIRDMPLIVPQIVTPQSAWALRIRNSTLWFMSKTKLYKLFGGDSEHSWQTPSYDWVDD